MSVWNDDERHVRDLWAVTPAPPSLRSRYESARVSRALRHPHRTLRPLAFAAALAAAIAVGGIAFGAHRLASQGGGHAVKPTPPPLPTSSAPPAPTQSPAATPSPSAAVPGAWPTHHVSDGVVFAMVLDQHAIFALVAPAAGTAPITSDTLVRIDRATGARTTGASFSLGTSLVRVGADVWVGSGGAAATPPQSNGTVLRFDAATLAPRGTIALPGGSATGDPAADTVHLAAAGSTVVAGLGSNVLVIDASTGVTRRTIGAGFQRTVEDVALSPSADRLYVATGDASTQTRVLTEWDPASGQAALGTPSANVDSVSPVHLAATATGVWVSRATGMLGDFRFHVSGALNTVRDAAGAPDTGRDDNNVHTTLAGGVLWVVGVQLRCSDPASGATRAIDAGTIVSQVISDAGGTYVGTPLGIDQLTPPRTCYG
jgi:hypothetical protein